jgi:hypothetical protein
LNAASRPGSNVSSVVKVRTNGAFAGTMSGSDGTSLVKMGMPQLSVSKNRMLTS